MTSSFNRQLLIQPGTILPADIPEIHAWIKNGDLLDCTACSCSLADYRELIASQFAGTPLFKDSLTAVSSMLENLPLPVSNNLGFEKKLSAGNHTADLSLSVDPSINIKEREVILGLDPGEYPHWTETKALVNYWYSGQETMEKLIKEFWLEFDAGTETAAPAPCVFIIFKPGRLVSDLPETTAQILGELLRKCYRIPRIDRIIASLFTCINNLPAQACLTHMGIMFTREPCYLRICVSIKAEQILPLLKSMGWQGDHHALKQMICDVTARVDYFILAFNLAEQIFGPVGLECFIRKEETDYLHKWELFSDYLLSQNLCLPKLGQWLRQLKGTATVKKAKPHDPAQKKSLYRAINWGINHMKINFTENNSQEAKIYFYMLGMQFSLQGDN